MSYDSWKMNDPSDDGSAEALESLFEEWQTEVSEVKELDTELMQYALTCPDCDFVHDYIVMTHNKYFLFLQDVGVIYRDLYLPEHLEGLGGESELKYDFLAQQWGDEMKEIDGESSELFEGFTYALNNLLTED